MSAGLEAVTVTPGIMAPVVSLTIPSIVLCAEANDGNSTRSTKPARIYAASLALVMTGSSRTCFTQLETLFRWLKTCLSFRPVSRVRFKESRLRRCERPREHGRGAQASGRDPIAVTVAGVHAHNFTVLFDESYHLSDWPAADGTLETKQAVSKRLEALLRLDRKSTRLNSRHRT